MQIENVDMRIIKWPQQFHKKSYVTSVSLLLVSKTCQYWTQIKIRISNSLPYKIYYEHVVDVTLLLYLLN